MRMNDLTGQRFGRLLVVKKAGNNQNNKVMWLCACECGREATVIGSRLYTGKTLSCGCLTKEKTIERSTKHGLSSERTYSIRMGMISRCTNKNNSCYNDYGGRGITVCDEWLNKHTGAKAFHEWALLNGYSDDLSIDRIDNDGNYDPNNCRWVNMEMQSLNRRKRSDNKSGVAGVYFDSAKSKWISTIQTSKASHYLGAFDKFEDAARARGEAEMKYLNKET